MRHIFQSQDRIDLVGPELAEAEVIAQFLPEALTDEAIEKVVITIIDSVGAVGMKDMGKVMGLVSQRNWQDKLMVKQFLQIVKSKLS